eukprot:102989_1
MLSSSFVQNQPCHFISEGIDEQKTQTDDDKFRNQLRIAMYRIKQIEDDCTYYYEKINANERNDEVTCSYDEVNCCTHQRFSGVVLSRMSRFARIFTTDYYDIYKQY